MKTQTKRIREAIEPVLCKWHLFNVDFDTTWTDTPENNEKKLMADLIEAIAPLIQSKKEMTADTWALLGGNDPELNAKLEAEDLMRARAEKALNKTPDWDGKQSPWCNYHKKLVKKEEKTGFTIEQFVKWWNSSDFRSTQKIWLNPTKIDEFWVTAINETETTSAATQEPTEFQKAKEWTEAPRR